MSKVDMEVLKRLCADTSAGLLNCKNALKKADGDYDKAREYLKELGHSIAAKKSDREANDGVVGAIVSDDFGLILELNCETDFVARNEKFQEFVNKVLKFACQNKITSKEDLLKLKTDTNSTIDDEIKSQIAIFKENILLSKYHAVQLRSPGVIGFYVHNKYTDSLGKIVVLVSIESTGEKNKLKEIAKNIGIQVISYNPQGISVQDLDPKVVEEEKLKFQDGLAGKPVNIAEKIISGKLQKFYKEVILLEQELFMDPDKTVSNYIEEQEKELSTKIQIISYKKFALGLDDE
jgi:elongation factor Ts